MSKPHTENKVRSNALMGFYSLCRRLQVNPVKLMAAEKLPSSVLRSPDLMISYNSFAHLLNRSADSADYPLFGLAMSSYQGLKTFGPLGMLSAQCPTVADSLEVIKKYFLFHASGVSIELEVKGKETLLNLEIGLDPNISPEQTFELSLSLGYNVLREIAPARMNDARILFRHSPLAPLEEYAKHTSAKLDFEQDRYAISFPTAALQDPPLPASQEIKNYFESYLDKEAKVHQQPLPHKVSKLIHELIPTGEASITTIASVLDMHVRTLQRELSDAGTDFRTLIDEVRYEIARDVLKQELPITDLALNLGYSELSAFSRAFKRWSGLTPQRWRLEHSR